MSRLSRFKKGAVMKLPPMNTKIVKPSFESDDDDFQEKLPSLPKSKPKPTCTITGVSVEKPSTSKKRGTSSANTVESIYFNTDGNVAISQSSGRSESQEDEEKRNIPSKKTQRNKLVTKKEELPCSFTREVDNEDEMVSDTSNKVVCPFCWKKLSDKLSGTTHVKSCGKNLPTERIFEALQLHEKQVKEWEGLGIAYPGFATSSNAKIGKPKGSKPRSRAKKNKDPELELAMALSVSLHEEIEVRKLKEKQFLVETGLEKELEALESKDRNKKEVECVSVAPPVSYRQRPEKKAKLKLPTMLSGQGGQDIGVGKRRGKKDVNLTETKLYTTTETERQNIINERVGLILEESCNVVLEDFYVRDKTELPVDVPKRLKAFHKVNSPLWKLAELDSNTADMFIIQDVAESKVRHESETVPENNPSSSKTDLISENQEAEEKPFVMPEVFPLPNPVPSRNIIPKISKENMIEVPKVPMVHLSPKPRQSTNCSISSECLSSQTQQGNSESYLPRVVLDLMKMLSKRSFTDIILYGREEKPIKCHKLLLRARCPKILEDVVEARSSTSGKVRELISLVGYSHIAVKAFVTFVYSGFIRRSLNAEELVELHELAEKYDMPLICDEPREPPPKRVKTMNIEIQTDSVIIEKNSSFTQTEDMESKKVACIREDVDKSSDDIFDVSGAMENSKSISLIDRKPSSNDTISNNPIFNDSDDKLFQNLSELGPCEAEFPKEIIEDADDNDNGNVSEDMFADFDDDDDDAFFNEVVDNIEENENCSKSPQESTQSKKRTRSISQLSNSSVTSFSATQAALYWRKQLNKQKSVEARHSEENEQADSRNDEISSPSSKKYAKKYRVDTNASESEKSEDESDSVLNRNVEEDEVEVIVIDDSDNETVYETHDSPKENSPAAIENPQSKTADNSINLEMSLSWEDTYARVDIDLNTMDNCCEDASIIESPNKRNSTVYETPKSRSSCRPRTENTFTKLSIENVRSHSTFSSPSYSPLKTVNSKTSFLDRSNPNSFGDHDDSVFAKIPEEMFSNPVDDQCAFMSEREISPIHSNVCDESNRKGRGKGKSKGGSNKATVATKAKSPTQVRRNKKGHRGHSYSQEPQSNCKTPPSIIETADGRTPMLNYSTIDTPILKNELKRFGLKQLPRTKAKVLLRHIYKETHK